MIFYGTKASRLKEGQINNVICPNCENQTSMNYGIFGKYFYIYWIPIFPIGKTNVLECNSCKRTFKLKELPEQIKHKFELVKHKGVPILHFSGLALIVLIVSYLNYSNSKEKELEPTYINNPIAGDIYSIKGQSGHYTTMKVTNVTSDSVFVVFNDYEIDRQFRTYKIDKDENYTNSIDGYTKEEIVSLYAKKTIYEVKRE